MRIVSLYVVYLKLCLSHAFLNHFQMITDVVTAFEQPTTVVAKVCWKPIHKIKMTKMLMTSKTPMSIKFLGENVLMNSNVLENHLLYLVDNNCRDSKHFFDQASALNMYNKLHRWLVIGRTDTLMEELVTSNILVDSEFVVVEEQDDKGFTLQAIYKIKSNGDWIVEAYANWTHDGGLTKSKSRMSSTAMRRKDLRGTTITTSAVISDNATRKDYAEVSNVLIDPITKSTCCTVKNIYEFLNATEKVIFTDTWGYLVNGTWTGIVGDIYRGEAELCGTIMFMSEPRLTAVDFLRVPAGVPASVIVFRQPPLSYENNLFYLPFANGVWYSLGAFTVILIIILYINANWDMKIYQEEKNIDQTCLRGTWSDIIIFVLSAISQQGSSNELKGNLGRLVMFIVFLAFVFFYTSYSANIIVLLQSTSDRIRTISDLTNSKLEFGIEDVSYNKYYFSIDYARDPIRKEFYKTKVAPKQNYLSVEEGVKRMQTQPFAFNMNTGVGYKIVSQFFHEHEKCGLQEIDYIRSGNAYYCSRKYSPFNEMYRVVFNRFEEHGISARNTRQFFEKKPSCTVTGGNFESVNMVDFYPVLLLLLYGMILSFVFLAIEIWIHRKQKTKKRPMQEF